MRGFVGSIYNRHLFVHTRKLPSGKQTAPWVDRREEDKESSRPRK
jgi:hypothetical protein